MVGLFRRSPRFHLLVILLPLVLLFPADSRASNRPGVTDPPLRGVYRAEGSPRESFTWFPEDRLYEPYLANPRTPRFALNFFSVAGEEIPRTGTSRLAIEMGSTFELVRFWKRWQVDLGIGFIGWFDRDHSLDNIGWDGIYSLSLSRGWGDLGGLRFQFLHISSHRGDEFVNRVRAEGFPTLGDRINYTREELSIGFRLNVTSRLGGYLEGGWGTLLNNKNLQEPGRLQTGLEYKGSLSRWLKGLGWHTALDLESFEENDWNLDTTVVTGLSLDRGEGVWRLELEYHNGRVPLGEFFRSEEEYIGVGLSMEP